MAKTSQQELSETTKPTHSFLEKKVLDTLDDYYKFEAYCQRPNLSPDQKRCVVTAEVFDLLSQGLPTPFMDIKGIKVFNVDTKEKAEALLKQDTATVIIR